MWDDDGDCSVGAEGSHKYGVPESGGWWPTVAFRFAVDRRWFLSSAIATLSTIPGLAQAEPDFDLQAAAMPTDDFTPAEITGMRQAAAAFDRKDFVKAEELLTVALQAWGFCDWVAGVSIAVHTGGGDFSRGKSLFQSGAEILPQVRSNTGAGAIYPPFWGPFA